MSDVQYNATLIHGETYVYGGTRFRKGVSEAVTAETKEYLEEAATYEKKSIPENDTDPIDIEVRCKFAFTTINVDGDEDHPDQSGQPRQRSRN